MSDLLCPHILAGTATPLGNPPWIKVVNPSPVYVSELAVQYPRANIVVRFEHDDPELYDPPAAAREWYARRLPELLRMQAAAGERLVVELPRNEPPSILVPLLVPFYQVLLPLMYSRGFRVAVGNPSVGEWHEGAWPQFAPVLRLLHPGSYLSVHEYWRNGADLENRWLTARWSIPEIAAVIGDTELLVGECGRDAIDGRGGPWQTTTWDDNYVDELLDYAALLRGWPQVKAAFVYTLGSENDARWRHYEAASVWPDIVAEYAPPAPPAVGPLPQDETATDPATLAEKARYWFEEATRQVEAGNIGRALEIMHSAVRLGDGLFYRLENVLKEAK